MDFMSAFIDNLKIALLCGVLPVFITQYAFNYFHKNDRNEIDQSWRKTTTREILSLRESVSKCKSDVREKDRVIQSQRETIERLEHRVAADTKSIRFYTNMIKIKDDILIVRNRTTKELNEKLVEDDSQIRNLQWDIESLQAQAEEKDKLLWVMSGRDSHALETIWGLQSQLGACLQVLNAAGKADNKAIDYLENKYVGAIGLLSEKLDDVEKRLRKQTADAKECRARIAKDMPYYVECAKVKDVALRIAEAMLKSSEAEREILLEEKANYNSQQLLEQAKDLAARDVEIAEYKSKADTDSKTTKADCEELANRLTKVCCELDDARCELTDAQQNVASRNLVCFRLQQQYESSKAAASEREGLQTQLSTLDNELSECKGRLSTVNTKVLDQETQLASALKAKEELEIKQASAIKLAEHNANSLGFAQHAPENSINQIRKLNSEYNAVKLSKQQCETAFKTSQRNLAEMNSSMLAQKEQANRLGNQLLRTEARYKEAMTIITELQGKLETSTACVVELSTNVSEQANAVTAQVSHLQDKLQFTKTLSKDMRTLWDQARAKAKDLKKQLDVSTELVAKSEARANSLEQGSINLSASLAAVQAALREKQGVEHELAQAKTQISILGGTLSHAKENMHRDSRVLQRVQQEMQSHAAAHAEALAANKDQISKLEVRVRESDARFESVSSRLRQANEGRMQAVYKLDTAMRLIHKLNRKNAKLADDLREESRAREEAEGYVAVDEVDSDDVEVEEMEEIEDEAENVDDGDDGDDGNDEAEEKEDEKIENVEVIGGREPAEGEEGFEFVETE
jgi:chromosome segregation ATPase